MSPRRTWMLAWLGGPLIGIANGTVREVAYKDRVGELTAHQISTGSALALFAGYFELLARLRPLCSTREALEVGVAWLALTIAFEFGFGRCVAHSSWRELLADYDLRKGACGPSSWRGSCSARPWCGRAANVRETRNTAEEGPV